MGAKSHYRVLGVNRDAPDEVIRAAHRALSAKFHPDKNPGDATAERNAKCVNEAFAELDDPEKRRAYDRKTAPAPSEAPPPAPPPPRREPATKPAAAADAPRWKVPGEQGRPAPVASAAEKVAVGAAGGAARVIGWLIGAAAVSATAALIKSASADREAAERATAARTATTAAATVAAAPPLTPPDVPPLLASETAPGEPPNYFEPKEVGGSTMAAAFYACRKSAKGRSQTRASKSTIATAAV